MNRKEKKKSDLLTQNLTFFYIDRSFQNRWLYINLCNYMMCVCVWDDLI